MANIVTIVINPISPDFRDDSDSGSLSADAEGELRDKLARFGTITSVTSS